MADAELIRHQLTGGAPWSVLGQSFGGFCAVTYLSKAPQGLAEAFITGGLPGLTSHAEDVYRLTYPKVAEKTREHYARYPGDVELAQRIARHLAANDERLPTGAPLTAEAFQALGITLGSSTGSHQLHFLLEDAFDGARLGDDFLYRVLPIADLRQRTAVRHACTRPATGRGRRPGGRLSRVRPAEFDAAAGARRRAAALHRRDDLPVDVHQRSGARSAR